jgi:hypothetical protein
LWLRIVLLGNRKKRRVSSLKRRNLAEPSSLEKLRPGTKRENTGTPPYILAKNFGRIGGDLGGATASSMPGEPGRSPDAASCHCQSAGTSRANSLARWRRVAAPPIGGARDQSDRFRFSRYETRTNHVRHHFRVGLAHVPMDRQHKPAMFRENPSRPAACGSSGVDKQTILQCSVLCVGGGVARARRPAPDTGNRPFPRPPHMRAIYYCSRAAASTGAHRFDFFSCDLGTPRAVQPWARISMGTRRALHKNKGRDHAVDLQRRCTCGCRHV